MRKGWKHYREWLEELEEPERTQAFDNLRTYNTGLAKDEHCNSIHDAISIGLKQWQCTPQGFDYWRSIYNKYSTEWDKMEQIAEGDPHRNMGRKRPGLFPGYMPKVYSINATRLC